MSVVTAHQQRVKTGSAGATNEAGHISRQIDVPDIRATYFGLYRFATTQDLMVVLVSCFCAAASGAALPAMTIIFGKLSALFQLFVASTISYDELVRQLDLYTLDFVYIAIGQFVVSYLALWGFIYTGERLTQRIRSAYLAALLRQNVGLFDKLGAGEITTRITADMQSIQDGLSEKVSQTISAFATFVAAFIIGFVSYWKLALILLSVPLAIVILILVGFTFAAKSSKVNLTEVGTAGTMAYEVLDSIRTVAALGIEESMARKFEAQILIAKKYGKRSRVAIDVIVGAMQSINFAAFGLIFWLGSRYVASGEEQFGSVVTLALALTMGAMALGRVTPHIRAFSECVNAASKIMSIIGRSSCVDAQSNGGVVPSRLDGHIRFQNIKQIYPSRPDINVMQDFSLEIPAGKTTAIVGASGSGKSTIIQLLQRFYLPVQGRILIDGIDIETLNLKWLRSKMALVSQEPLMFKGTVIENISNGLSGTSHAEADPQTVRQLVVDAAKLANADDFIRDLDDGYDTVISGTSLSGGQKQRVAIARAIIRKPAILLLDEATSALDTKSERLVQEAIEQASSSRTTVIIAHRLSTIKHADNIVVMAHGEVVEQGTHSELLQKNGAYTALVNAQELSRESEPGQSSAMAEVDADRLTTPPRGTARSSHATMTESLQSPRGPLTPFDSVTQLSNTQSAQAATMSKTATRLNAVTEASLKRADQSPPSQKSFLRNISFVNRFRRQAQGKRLNGPTDPVDYGTWTLMKFVASLNKGDVWIISLVLVASSLMGGAFPTNSVFFAEAIVAIADAYNDGGRALSEASFWSLMYLMLSIVMMLIFLVQGFSHATAAERLLYRARSRTYRALLRQEIGFFDDPKHSTGALVGLLASQPAGLAGMSGITLGTVLTAVSTTLVALIVSIAVGWQLALVCASTIPVLLLCGYLRVKVISLIEAKLKTAHDESARFASESISAIREVASLTLENHVLARFHGMLAPELRSILVSSGKSSFFFALSQSLVFLCFALGFWYGGTQIAEGRYSLLQFFICFSTVIFGAQASGQIFSYAPDMSKAAQAATILKGLFERKPKVETAGDRVEMLTGNIELRDVHFTYPSRPERPALRGIDLSIHSGQSIALVGASGCGKSTIISLLERFYEPDQGQILVDGQDISKLDLAQYRSRISIVPQQPLLYHGSIRKNILYGAPDGMTVSDSHFERVCRDADVWDFVNSLPDGFETLCGSRGGLLSGGQKQRVAIARALIRNPQILLLDEPTAALDSKSEQVVQQALDKASASRTTMFVSHRLSAIQGADVIFVMESGRIVEKGSHSDLCKLEGRYAELVQAQTLVGGDA